MPNNPSIIDVQDVTALSKIIACDYDYYNSVEHDQYTLFIVNNGNNGSENPVVDFFYGDNRLSQILIMDSLPEIGVEGKVYIKKTSEAGEGDLPIGIYIWLTNDYLCLTDIATSGYLSSDSINAIATALFDKVATSYVRPTWKTLP